jgi:Peptidase family M23
MESLMMRCRAGLRLLQLVGWLSVSCFIVANTGTRAAEDAASDVLSPLVALTMDRPGPVQGADGRTHLVYELLLVNFATDPIALTSVETRDADSGAVLGTLEGVALKQVLRLNGGGKGSALPGGGSAVLFMDVTYGSTEATPKALKHRFTITVGGAAKPAASDGDRDPTPAAAPTQSFTGAKLSVERPAVVIAPPLKGPRWVIGGGCCATVTYHRGATLPLNGSIHVAERYAIDFVQLDAQSRLASGPINELASFRYFGEPVFSVAAGRVVGIEDGLPEQVPGKLPADATIQMAAGNHVVVDIGEGRYAFYAHLQPGSLRVKTGDKVGQGQVLGLLGNSGNTDGPHLHFHMMDGPSPLVSNGLPYAFTSFTGEGRIVDEKAMESGAPVSLDEGADALTGAHHDQLPLNLQVIAFPE